MRKPGAKSSSGTSRALTASTTRRCASRFCHRPAILWAFPLWRGPVMLEPGERPEAGRCRARSPCFSRGFRAEPVRGSGWRRGVLAAALRRAGGSAVIGQGLSVRSYPPFLSPFALLTLRRHGGWKGGAGIGWARLRLAVGFFGFAAGFFAFAVRFFALSVRFFVLAVGFFAVAVRFFVLAVGFFAVAVRFFVLAVGFFVLAVGFFAFAAPWARCTLAVRFFALSVLERACGDGRLAVDGAVRWRWGCLLNFDPGVASRRRLAGRH